jgi:peptidoglycan hydrolase-like protein with peptidoglycan-binding domain
MTPRLTRVALGGFLALAVGVAVNALSLQGKPQSSARPGLERTLLRNGSVPAPKSGAPQVSRAQAPGKPERVFRFGQFASSRDGELAPDTTASPRTVRALQRELRQLGYGALPSDGVLRVPTRAAIMAFEYDGKLPLTGEASDALLARVVLGTPSTPRAQGGAEVGSQAAEAVVRAVQRALRTLGYQIARVDGQLDEETVRAIREFEVDKGLVPKGRISFDVVARLKEAPELASAQPSR